MVDDMSLQTITKIKCMGIQIIFMIKLVIKSLSAQSNLVPVCLSG